MAEPGVLAVHGRSAEAEGISLHSLRTGGDSEQGLDRLFLKNTHSVVAQAEVHKHLVEFEMVLGRAPEACAGRCEDVAVIVRTLLPGVFLHPFARSVLEDLVHFYLILKLPVAWPEPGRFHSERIQHALPEVVFPFHSGHDLDHGCGYVYACVGVFDVRARLEEYGAFGRYRGYLTQRSSAGPAAAAHVTALGAAFEREAAGVVEAHSYGEWIFGFPENSGAVVFAFDHPERTEFRKVFIDRIVELEAAFLYQLGHGHPAEALGLGALHEYIVHGNRSLVFYIGITQAAGLLYTVVVEYADDPGHSSALYERPESFLGEVGS